MAIPLRLTHVTCLIVASALGLLVAGCAEGLGAPSLSGPAAHSPTASRHHKAQPATALDLNWGSQAGRLTPRDATLTCSAKDKSVELRGSVVGELVTVRLIGLRSGQQLAVPPPVGGYADRVTVTVSGANPTQSLTYVVGFTDGNYQGVGNIDVGKHGTSGTLNVSVPSPVGQAPQIQATGLFLNTGLNRMSLSGTWKCP